MKRILRDLFAGMAAGALLAVVLAYLCEKKGDPYLEVWAEYLKEIEGDWF